MYTFLTIPVYIVLMSSELFYNIKKENYEWLGVSKPLPCTLGMNSLAAKQFYNHLILGFNLYNNKKSFCC